MVGQRCHDVEQVILIVRQNNMCAVLVQERIVVDLARALGCDLKQIAAIGDGANDVPMLKKAGTGIGYFGKPAVVEATPHQIRHTDLVSVLYMQGYRQQELGQ